MTDTPKRRPGRPPIPADQRKKMTAFRLAPDVIEILQAQANASQYIEDAVREKAGFDRPA